MAQNPTKLINVGETKMELDKFSFVWNVSNYSDKSKLWRVESPVFHGGSKTNHGWQLSLYPNESVNGRKCVSLYVQIVSHGEGKGWWGWRFGWSPVQATLRLTLLNRDGQAVYKQDELKLREFYAPHTLIRPCYYGWREFISCSLLNHLNLVIDDDKLKILCEIDILAELNQSVGKRGLAECSPSDEERIKRSKFEVLDDLGRMFKESIGTDITVCTGTTTFKAHKAILSARSPVFAAMFTVNMIEKETASLQIKDFEDEVVKGMLEHLYTGQIDCMSERAPELLQIAEKYELIGLKEDCQYVIADKLDKENAAVILVLADSHNAPYLKQRAMDFISLNKEELLKTKTFQDAVKTGFDNGLLAELYLSQQ